MYIFSYVSFVYYYCIVFCDLGGVCSRLWHLPVVFVLVACDHGICTSLRRVVSTEFSCAKWRSQRRNMDVMSSHILLCFVPSSQDRASNIAMPTYCMLRNQVAYPVTHRTPDMNRIFRRHICCSGVGSKNRCRYVQPNKVGRFGLGKCHTQMIITGGTLWWYILNERSPQTIKSIFHGVRTATK